MRAIWSMERGTARALCSLATAPTTLGAGSMIRCTALARFTMPPATLSTLESGATANLTVKAATSTKIWSISMGVSTIEILMSWDASGNHAKENSGKT